ncbi:MAG: hypothetical protein ABFE07_02300 [Armatimonadia bacterium]
MKNDTAKPLRVILLDGKGKTVVGAGCTWRTRDHGKVGFALVGTSRVLYWADEGKTWKRAEESR